MHPSTHNIKASSISVAIAAGKGESPADVLVAPPGATADELLELLELLEVMEFKGIIYTAGCCAED